MIDLITDYIDRRHWAHIRACYDFGRTNRFDLGWLDRHLRYDRLFRENMRIAKLMAMHGHKF